MTETNNSKSDKEKLDEIMKIIEEKNYLLTKDYVELKKELEEYFQICMSISNKNLNLENEAKYVAGLIKEQLGKYEDALSLFNYVANNEVESNTFYQKSKIRIFLMYSDIITEFYFLKKSEKEGNKYLPLTNEELELFKTAEVLFSEIESFYNKKYKIKISLSEILFPMSRIVKIKDNFFNKETSNGEKEILERILKSNDEEYKAVARHHLVMNLIEDLAKVLDDNKTDKEFEEKLTNAFNQLNKITGHNNIVLNKILELINLKKFKKEVVFLLKIYLCVNKIKDNLRILEPININSFLLHEKKVAHYTSPLVAYKLLNENSNIRLNTINNVNDPTEGLVLKNYLELNSAWRFSNQISNRIGAFVGCFTFNHDSLNQFRLYGKNNGIEASGVSIVFNINFFNTNEYEDNSLYLNNKKKDMIKKTRLYRCIYLDPKSSYISLARRNKITFYKQYKNKLDLKEINILWEKYNNNINIIENGIKIDLLNLLNLIKFFSSKESYNEISYIINLILLPLQYLVKHAAFQEEQECRIICLTDRGSDKIIREINNKLIYINYIPETRKFIDKVYFSPGAKDYKDFFISNLNEHQLRDSLNPFRNK